MDVGWCWLGDDGLRPVLGALRGSLALRRLTVNHNAVSPAFVRDELVPSVAANVSLRALVADGDPNDPGDPPMPGLAEVEAGVAARGAAAV